MKAFSKIISITLSYQFITRLNICKLFFSISCKKKKKINIPLSAALKKEESNTDSQTANGDVKPCLSLKCTDILMPVWSDCESCFCCSGSAAWFCYKWQKPDGAFQWWRGVLPSKATGWPPPPPPKLDFPPRRLNVCWYRRRNCALVITYQL